MIAPYLYDREEETPGTWRLWLAGTDRAGVFRVTEPVRVITADPDAYLAAHPNAALNLLDAGHGAILKIAGRLKQLDDDEATAWQEIRDERADRLIDADGKKANPNITQQLRELYEDYQQALRDIPQAFASPYVVVWPDEPSQDDITEPPEWAVVYDRIKTLAQSGVGVDLGELTDPQKDAFLAVLLHEHRAFGADGTIRPLGEWVQRRVDS